MRAEIIKQDGNEVTMKIFDELTEEDKSRYEINGRLFAVVELFDPDSITNEQRRHIYALLGDFEEYTGYTLESAESLFKVKFMHHEFLDELPSLAANRMTKTRASKFIEFIIIYYIQNGIPFRKDQIYLPRESSNFIFWSTMTRHCVICGKPHAEIHHATNLVGRGRNRRKHDHWNSTFLPLCREHHNEAHSLGLTEFMNKYLVKPVKLNKRQLKEIGVM